MAEIQPHVPAFPVTDPADGQVYGGLTKREYFAAMFTAAYINNPQNGNPINVQGNAECGLMQADALIEQLNK